MNMNISGVKRVVQSFFLAVLLAASLAFPAAGVAAQPMPLVEELEVQGVQRIEPDVILLKIQTRKGTILDREHVRQDIHTIMDTGYFFNVVVESKPLRGGVKVIFHVKERPTIREVRYEGNKHLEVKDFEAVVTLKANHFLNVSELKENVEKIRKLYANEGYFHAGVDYRVEGEKNNQVSIVFKLQENEEVKIRRIVFLGNDVFKEKKLRRIIESKKRNWLSWLTSSGVYKEDVLRDDATRLTLFYLDHGYLKFTVDPPLTLITDNGMYVFFVLNEGEQYKIQNLSWENASPEEEEVFKELQTIGTEDVFSRSKIQADILAMTDYYADRGYAFAEVRPLYFPNEETRTVNVVYEVEKGNIVHIGDIRVKGNTKTRDKVIRREMALVEGDLYSSSQLRKSRAEINRLGFFDEININTKSGDDKELLDVIIDVKEGQTGTLSGGAGFSSTDQFIFMANVTQSNLFGKAQVLSLNAEVGGTRQNFSVSFTEPWLFDIPLSAGFDAFNTERVYQDFTRKALGGAARLGYEFYEHVRANVMYKYEAVEIKDISAFASQALQSEVGESVTSSVTFSLVHDTLDNPLYPMEGFLNIGSVELAGTVFGGDNDFAKLQLDTGGYFPLFWGTTVHARARIGVGYGISGDRLPVFERFFIGGISTVRGFDVRSLGPEVEGTVIGGNKELMFNMEYIFPLVPQVKLRGLVFLDAGNAFSEDEDLRFDGLRLSAGAGFRWFSPLGPLTFVLGFPLDRREGEDPSAVQFSVGTPF